MRMIVILLMLVLSLSALTDSAAAQSGQFPYDAVILDDDVYARSGPGRHYYPTSRFRKGDRINVLRHDPGGWFMIEPPLGSFAWVRTEFVKRNGDRGVIVSDAQIVAWVGTNFGDDHFVEQRRLQRGEEVEILSEKTFKDKGGDVAYVKIKSPKGHYRWVPGSKVVTSEKQLAAAQARAKNGDPFASRKAGSGAASPEVAAVDLASAEPDDSAEVAADRKSVPVPKDVGKQPAPTPSELQDETSPSRSTARAKSEGSVASPFTAVGEESAETKQSEDRISVIDEQLREMLKRDTRDWDFTDVEEELRELQRQQATADAAARRLGSLQKYKQIKADYDEFARIMDSTNRRDAELAAAQRGTMPNAAPAIGPSVPTNPRAGSGVRTPSSGTAAAPAIRTRQSPAQSRSGEPTKGKLSGAGVIQRTNSKQPGAPKHVLVHPNGRMLAYLHGDGVDLDKYLGESMGVEGNRSFRQELGADLVIVRAVQPVKLKP